MGLTPRLALAGIGSTAVYLGLAILLRGGWTAFFTQPALTAVAVITVALLAASMFSQGNLSPGIREARGNRWVFVAFGILGVLGGFLPAYTDRVDLWSIDGNTVRWIGVALFAAGGALRIWPVFVLGHRFSGLVAIQPGHTLVTSGIYGTVRNPSYLGLLVNALGWALAFRSMVGVLLSALTLVPLLTRIRAEEGLLADEFGAEYAAYRQRTWRLIPYLF